MILAIVSLPLVLALVAALVPGGKAARPCLVAVALAYLGAALCLGAAAVADPAAAAAVAPSPALDAASRIAALAAWPAAVAPYVRADGLSVYLFLVMSIVNLAASLYGVGYLGREGRGREGSFAAAFLAFDASMAGVLFSNHLALLWVFLEATTLAGAYLVAFEREKASLEATWKYLFICSIGITLAFVSVILLALAGSPSPSLFFDDLAAGAAGLDPFWLRMALAFAIVGFGTKVGLAPMHAWLPDAHSEAPGAVSAILSGALLNAAFVPIFRLLTVMDLAGSGRYARALLVVSGFLSVLVCAAFASRVRNYKRLLAYSSVENMGIVAIGAGLGGIGAIAALLHVAAHSFAKASLFLTAGTIYEEYGSKKCDDVRGLAKRDALAATLWIASFAAISGIPPFPSFLSKFLTARACFDAGSWWLVPIFLVLLVAVLAGMGRAFMAMAFSAPASAAGGNPSLGDAHAQRRPGWLAYAPQLLLLALLLVLDLGAAGPARALLEAAASCL